MSEPEAVLEHPPEPAVPANGATTSPDGVAVLVSYDDQGDASIVNVSRIGTTRSTEILTILEKALQLHRQQIGLGGD